MTIKLYKIPDDAKKVDKTIIDVGAGATLLGELTAHTKENTSIFKPTLEVAYNAIYATANYMYIQDWGRYYYIPEPPTVGAQRMFITGAVDVLYTYRTGIRQIRAIVARQQDKSKGQLYMADKAFKSQVKKIISTRKLSGSFDKQNSSFILTTGGRS